MNKEDKKIYDAMIKRNDGKKKTVATTGDLGALAANTRVPKLKKSTIVKREDPNKRPRKFSDYIQRSGDSPLVALVASSLAKTGLVDKKDKVTQPYEAKSKKKGGIMKMRGGGIATQGTKFSIR
tara:strand:- start:147 stop:518 length:372 start_codon:yes stop_codon:yes gene_type:complete